MKQINRKKLVLALIKDDLINTKLIKSLNQIGLEANHYNLHVSTIIMNLMNIKTAPLEWEAIHDSYLDLIQKVMQIDIQQSPLLDALSEEVYSFLKTQKLQNKNRTNKI